MTWALDESGELTPEIQLRFVELILERAQELERAANQLDVRLRGSRGTDAIFESVDGILIAAARIATTLKPVRDGKAVVKQVRNARRTFMEQHFGDPKLAILQERTVRHRVEHYDEYLEEAAITAGLGAGRVRLVGPRDAISITGGPAPIWERHFDPDTGTYSVIDDETVNIREVVKAGRIAGELARKWIAANDPRSARL